MASGNTLLIFTPQAAYYPDTAHAYLGSRNNHLLLSFEDGTTVTAYFTAVMPQLYGGGGITVYIHWAHVAVTGTVIWEFGFERIGDGVQDIDTDGFATNNVTAGITVPATSGLLDVTSIAFTNGADMDSVVAGDAFRTRITRSSTDTAVGDAQVMAVELRET